MIFEVYNLDKYMLIRPESYIDVSCKDSYATSELVDNMRRFLHLVLKGI